MKKIIYYALILGVFVFGQTFAQSVAEQNLNSALQSAEYVKQEVTVSRKAVNQLVKQLVIIGNPNTVSFSNSIDTSNDNKVANANDIDSFVALAKANSTINFSTSQINALTSQILDQNSVIAVLKNQIVTAIGSNNTSLALNLVTPLRNALTKQVNKANNIKTKIEQIKLLVKTYNVCIKVIDNQGNAAVYQPGFYAYNTVTGEYVYPNNDQGNQTGGDCFLNLPVGTYSFGGFQDYFCGVSGTGPLTLSDSLLNEDGIIEVTLLLWCE
jgi:hypothetical protein